MSNIINTAAGEIISAAKTNDCEKLISLLSDENLKWAPEFRNLKSDLSALETAILTGNLGAANLLACYEALGRNFIKDKRPHEIVATKSVWCRCLSNSIAYRKKGYERIEMRASVSNNRYVYIGRESGTSSIYTIVRDHYSKLLTPFEAIERPAAFMALMRLDDDFKILSPEGLTLAMHVLQSKKITKCFKRALLQFIAYFDTEIMYVPSGPEGLTPAAYCLKTNNIFLFRELQIDKYLYQFRSADGKDIMHFCNNYQLGFVSDEERTKLYTECDGALNTFLIRNTTHKLRQTHNDRLAVEAIEVLAKNGKKDQLKEFIKVVTDKATIILMAQLGYEGLDKSKSLEVQIGGEKANLKTDPDLQTTFDFVNLPSDMAELIMAALTARDILNLFVVNKSMRTWFNRFDSNALWRQILRNTKLALDGDVPMPANDFKKYALTTERCKENWRKGRFGTKTLVTVKEYGIHPLVDDNWICCLLLHNRWLFCNMNTAETIQDYELIDGTYRWVHANETVVESPPVDPPLIAQYSVEGNLSFGRAGRHAFRELISLPPAVSESPIVFAQSVDRVAVGKKLRVVDLTTKSVVASLEDEIYVHSAISNPFKRSMSLGTDYKRTMIFDKDMCLVQCVPEWISDFTIIDEFTLCARKDGKLVLYDLRKFQAGSYQVLVDDAHLSDYTIDVRNQRALVRTGPYELIAQIDLKTRQWERVWQPLGAGFRINDKYMIFSQSSFMESKLIAYDFTI